MTVRTLELWKPGKVWWKWELVSYWTDLVKYRYKSRLWDVYDMLTLKILSQRPEERSQKLIEVLFYLPEAEEKNYVEGDFVLTEDDGRRLEELSKWPAEELWGEFYKILKEFSEF